MTTARPDDGAPHEGAPHMHAPDISMPHDAAPARAAASGAAHAPWAVTVMIPFYNEEAYIGATLRSLAGQTRPPAAFVLVDNASTDRSAEICEAFRRERPGTEVTLLREEKPGKLNALETALPHAKTPFIAFCDADTAYPPHYLETAAGLFAQRGDGLAGAMALGVTADPESPKGRFQRLKGAAVGALLAKQCHTGGYGQIFRTEIFLKTGGYANAIWPFVLSDHEITHRVLKHGACAYHRDLWCRPSTRRGDRRRVTWTLFERLVYHATPFALKDWFFYDFLWRRFERRQMSINNLRAQPWAETDAKAP